LHYFFLSQGGGGSDFEQNLLPPWAKSPSCAAAMPPRLKFGVHACSGEARAPQLLRKFAAGSAANADAHTPASRLQRRTHAPPGR
jgi:hypothetical protein